MTNPLHNNFTALTARMDAAAVTIPDWEALSERFQGTIGRTFWYDVSAIYPTDREGVYALVHVYAPRDDADHIHVEVTDGTIEETLSSPALPTDNKSRFQEHSVYMTYEDWKTLMSDLMDAAWSDSI